jgi:hypothetical protein
MFDLLEVSVSDDGGFPRLRCELRSDDVQDAARSLARSIAERRIGVNPRLHELWTSHLEGSSTDPVDETDIQLLKAGLLQNIGTPDQAGPAEHLHGLIAESVWLEVVGAVDVGLGQPLRIEGHDWSVTDPGGDGLTVYRADDGFLFRLWESKYHGTSAAVRETANLACRQLRSRAIAYLARFSLIAQTLANDAEVAAFYGQLPEMWVNKEEASGVGINVAAAEDADTAGDFDNVPSYFDLELAQHQSAIHLIGDIEEFANVVRNEIWKGCGLWTAP